MMCSLTKIRFLVAGLLCLAPAHLPASTLSSNLSAIPADVEEISGDVWDAANFRTDGVSRSLDNVILSLGNSVSGSAVASLYLDNNFQPYSLIGTLTSPASFPSGTSDVTFDGNRLLLQPNSSYWIVLSAASGNFEWTWTESNSGTGVGFEPNWAVTVDAGSSWSSFSSEPLLMEVNASPTPEPSTFVFASIAFCVGGTLVRLSGRPSAPEQKL